MPAQKSVAVRPGFVPLPFVEAPEPEASPIQDLPGVVESPGQAGYLLYYDELTGLYNRRLYARRFPEEAQRAREEKLPLSLIWLNVNGFKRINQEYGHVQGDHVLARVGAAIREVVGGAGIPVRYSGDEFVVLACGLALREAAELGNRILEAVRSRPVQLLNSQLTVQVSLTAGMACYPEVVADPDELLERANRAALRAKRERRDRLVATGSSEVVLDPAGLARRLPCPTLIGRHELLESLEKLLTPGAEEEKRPAVLLKGPSGIGKTRLLVALGERMRAQGCRFLMGSARQEAASQPFAALLEALEACIDREPRLLAALAEVLEAHETSALARFLPCLRPLAREGGDAAVPLRAPLARMLVRLSEMGPLVVCVDESQWIDRSTVEVLRALWQGQARLALCLALGTDDAEAGLEAGGHPLRPLVEEVRGEVVAVPPLGPAQVREMVEAILPFPVARGHLTTQVYQRSRGLPLLVEESLRYLVQTERLRLEDGKIVCDDEGSALPEDLLEARASHLADEVRRLLVHASAMGSDFSLTTLVDVEGRDEGYLRGLIDKAVQAGLLEAAEDGERFHFASSNLRRSLYREMDEQERRRLHRTISQARLREASGHTEMLLSELAHHSRLAGDAEQLSQIESQMQALQERYLPPGELSRLSDLVRPKDRLQDKQLSQEDLYKAGEALRCFRVLLKGGRFYGVDHPQIVLKRGQLLELLEDLLSRVPQLDLAEASGTILANGQRLGSDVQALGGLDIARDWSLQSVTFERGVTLSELKVMTEVLAMDPEEVEKSGGLSALLKERGVTHILPSEKIYVGVGERDILVRAESGEVGVIVDPTLEAKIRVMTGVAPAPPAGGDGQAHLAEAELANLMAARREVAEWYEEISKYVDLQYLEALSADWAVLVADLESGNRIKIAAACRAFLERGAESIFHLSQLVARTRDPRARKLAIRLLQRLGDDVSERLLTTIHSTTDPQELANLLAALEDFDSPSITDTLVAFVSHPSGRVRREAIRVLENQGRLALEAEIARLLQDRGSSPEVLRDCIEAVGRNRFTSLLRHLIRLVRRTSIFFFEGDAELQAEACRALGEMGSSVAFPTLLQALRRHGAFSLWRTKPAQVRSAAAMALSRLSVGETTAVKLEKALVQATRERHPTIRAAAKVALAHFRAQRYAHLDEAASRPVPVLLESDAKLLEELAGI